MCGSDARAASEPHAAHLEQQLATAAELELALAAERDARTAAETRATDLEDQLLAAAELDQRVETADGLVVNDLPLRFVHVDVRDGKIGRDEHDEPLVSRAQCSTQ